MSMAADETTGIVILGAGQAGVQAAEALRTAGFEGPITIVGEEPHGPYHRPPLSKAWLAGEMEAPQLVLRAPELLARKGITLRTGIRAAAIDRAACAVDLSDGSRLAYRGLVLATGATPRRLTLAGAASEGVYALRSRGDADAIAARLALCARDRLPLVVIGGGFIGLEVAATARKKGLAVTVVETASRLLGRVLAPQLSDWYAALHRSRGVDVRLAAQVTAIEADHEGVVRGVRLAGDEMLPAGMVVVGVGVAATDELARAAGLECDCGIVVDSCGRTADPLIVAAGDCTARRQPGGGLLRLESVNNATEQGKAAAAALMGQERPFNTTPWFWSEQYDKKLQMAGLSSGSDEWVVRGDMTAGSFSIFHFRAGRLVAADSINSAKEHLLVRKLLDAGVSPTPVQAADAAFDLAQLISKA